MDEPIHWTALATICLGGFGLLGAALYSGSDRGEGRRRRQIERSATVRIADATVGGLVKIVGQAEAIEPLLEAPLTGQAAIAFSTRADLLVYTERGGPPVFSRYRLQGRAQDFLVRDGSGVALVRAAGAAVVATPRFVAEESARSTRWLRSRHGHSRFLGILKRRFRFYEESLPPGAEVAVLGRCSAGAAAVSDGPYRDGGEPTLTIEAQIVTWS